MKTTDYEKVGYHIDIKKKLVNGKKAGGSHYHNAYELQYFIRGNVSFFVHDQIYEAKKGDVLFIDSYEIHNSTDITGECEKIVLIYRPSFAESDANFKAPDIFSLLNKKYGGKRLISLPEPHRPQIIHLFEQMLYHYGNKSPYSLIYLNSYLTLLITYIAEYLENAPADEVQKTALNQKISAIISYLEANLGSDITLDAIAGQFNANKSHLCRFFKRYTGFSLFDYINRSRIAAAEKLMLQGKHSITDICYMVGFNNLTHFERVFKQHSGMSPRNYRKMNAVKDK